MGSSWSDLIKVIISLLGQSLAILIDHHETLFLELRSSRCSTTLQLCADVTSGLLDHVDLMVAAVSSAVHCLESGAVTLSGNSETIAMDLFTHKYSEVINFTTSDLGTAKLCSWR